MYWKSIPLMGLFILLVACGEQGIKLLLIEDAYEEVTLTPMATDTPLATATSIDLSSIQRASGLLRKPYPREVLFAMIRELLGGSDGVSRPARADG